MSHDTWKARLHTKMDALAQWHQKIAFFHIIGPLPMTRLFVLLAIAASLFAALANYQIRANQYERWVDNKDVTFLDGTPLFSTTDASYFVGLSRQYIETGNMQDFTIKRLYPNQKYKGDGALPKTSITDFPLFSILIAVVSPDASVRNLMITAHKLIPWLAFLTALGILLAFGAAGFWMEGAVASIGAGLAPTFLMRTSVGRIDTDVMNLGFFYAILGVTILAARASSLRLSIIWVVTAAAILNLFLWWYDKDFIGWAFVIGLAWLSIATHRHWKRPLLLTLIFILISGLDINNLGISQAYLQDERVLGQLIYPNTFNTITELRVVPFRQILISITGSVALGVIGVFGLALFAFRHPVVAIVFGPASFFALANFLVGNRAVFYSAPMIWFGIAFVAIMIVRLVWRMLPERLKSYSLGETILCTVTICCLMSAIWSDRDTQNYTPTPSFPIEVVRALAAPKGKLPENSVIATWWDYGYASMLFNGYSTLHDGGRQTTPVTHYFARALLAKTQSETNAILHLLAGGGLEVIRKQGVTHMQLEDYMQSNNIRSSESIYLVLTNQMGDWMGSISNLGMWNTQTGTPIKVPNNSHGSRLFYSNLSCRPSSEENKVICNERLIDLEDGTINNAPAIRAFTSASDGVLTSSTQLNNQAINNLHLSEMSGIGTRVMLFHDRLARSSFHNLFHLLKVEGDYFELVYDDYPHARIFKVK